MAMDGNALTANPAEKSDLLSFKAKQKRTETGINANPADMAMDGKCANREFR